MFLLSNLLLRPAFASDAGASSTETVTLIALLLIGLSLSADCFAVALGASVAKAEHSRWRILRTAISFGLFQAAMPVIGWAVGRTIVGFISGYDHWVAFGLLALIGGKMVWESFKGEEEKSKNGDVTRGLMLFTLSLATSIDALSVGLSFAFLKVNIVAASLTIGIVCFSVTSAGFLLGRKAGKLVGERAETLGGLVLIGIGFEILLSHLL